MSGKPIQRNPLSSLPRGCSWNLFRSFKVCSNAKERVGVRKATGRYHTYLIPGKTAVLVPEFAVKDLPSAELKPTFCACSEGPTIGQNALDDVLLYHLTKFCPPACFPRKWKLIHIKQLYKSWIKSTGNTAITWRWWIRELPALWTWTRTVRRDSAATYDSTLSIYCSV